MHFLPPLIIVAAIAAFPFVSGVTIGKDDHLDPKCAHGQHRAFETNTFRYDIPATKFFNTTGSFFNAEWYIGPVSATTGKDNTVGSTRTASFFGISYRERLVEHSQSSSKLVLRYVLDNGPVLFTNISTEPSDVTFGSYTEEMTVFSICGGSATYISFVINLCLDPVSTGYDVSDQLHRAGITPLAQKLGARLFGGTCPICAIFTYSLLAHV